MIENEDPATLRQVYFDAWQKALHGLSLSSMETIIVDIISRHPEYHDLFSDADNFKEQINEKYALDHNPFFHLALHVTIAEQVGANRPQGIKHIYNQLLKKIGDKNSVEHKMIECLAQVLMDNVQQDPYVSEQIYVDLLKQLL